ncbi:hypothetical protein GCM10010169_60620 [Micromonospora fulviviridis]|nr:hypothetical protein GCM10010169_60620 [Micromonospora fulviviridis]
MCQKNFPRDLRRSARAGVMLPLFAEIITAATGYEQAHRTCLPRDGSTAQGMAAAFSLGWCIVFT